MRATDRCTGQRHMSAKAPTRASPEYRSNILGLKVKAVDKPGIIPARNRAEHLEAHHKAVEECSIRCGELQSIETTRRSAPGATIP